MNEVERIAEAAWADTQAYPDPRDTIEMDEELTQEAMDKLVTVERIAHGASLQSSDFSGDSLRKTLELIRQLLKETGSKFHEAHSVAKRLGRTFASMDAEIERLNREVKEFHVSVAELKAVNAYLSKRNHYLEGNVAITDQERKILKQAIYNHQDNEKRFGSVLRQVMDGHVLTGDDYYLVESLLDQCE